MNPSACTSKRREPPPTVLDFCEPAAVDAIARAAERGARRGLGLSRSAPPRLPRAAPNSLRIASSTEWRLAYL